MNRVLFGVDPFSGVQERVHVICPGTIAFYHSALNYIGLKREFFLLGALTNKFMSSGLESGLKHSPRF